MLPLILGLVIFFAAHVVPTSPGLRNGLIERFGAPAYKAAFSLVSVAGLVLIVMGYHKLQVLTGKNVEIWTPPDVMRHITFLLMIPALILLVASQIPSRIRTATKHPMLAGIKLWALAHLLVNGDLGSILLFGSFLGYAVFDRISVKRRAAAGPLGDKKGGPMSDVLVVVIALAIYVFMLMWGHAWLIDKPVLSVSFAP